MLLDHSHRRLRSASLNPRITIRGIANEREIIGDVLGPHTELRFHRGLIPYRAALSIHLNDTIADNALREILVGSPDRDFLDTLVLRREICGGRERIIGLELPHRPRRDTHRLE